MTSGPVVNESLETSVEGIFACGNVLHVHDLVDFVSQEAAAAGAHAAAYIKGTSETADADEKVIEIHAENGVRYTVPSTIRLSHMEDNLTVRFRVGAVYKNCYISTYLNDERIARKKRPVVAPGEMEDIRLKKETLEAYPDLKTVTVRIETE